ncbi:MAG: carboxypeptidase-like regulatory domain-containing protein, partial [Rhodothermales bacterium]
MVAAKACIYCILCSSFFVHTAFSQEIQGTVRDEAGARLPGVHVTLADLNTGTVTDEQGQYTLSNLGAGEYLVSFSFIGFSTQTRRVRIDTDNIELDVSLNADVLEADEVLIVEDRVDVLTRDSRSVSVLEPEDLVELRGQTLGETLEQLPGVTALQTGPSISKPVVRGLHSQRVLVLNAGISQEGQQWGGEHAPEIDPFAPVRIEVIKGVAGVEYGIGAIGGVIKLDPLELPYVPGHGVDGQLSLNGFSNNFQGAGALYLEGTASSIPGMGWRVQTSFRKAGDAHTPDYVIRNSAFREFNGSVSAGIKRDRISLVALASRFSTELGIFSGAHIGNINDLLRAIALDEPSFIGDFGYDIGPPKQNISHNLLSVHGDYHFDSGSWLELQYGFQVNRRREFDAHGRNNDDPSALEDAAFDSSLTSNTLELKFHHKPMGQFFGVMGVSGMSQLNKNAATGLLIPNYRA